jgi:hypothetical protein
MMQNMNGYFEKIILAIPHATRNFDMHLWDDATIVSKDADHWTDWFTDEIFDWKLEVAKANNFSSISIDKF